MELNLTNFKKGDIVLCINSKELAKFEEYDRIRPFFLCVKLEHGLKFYIRETSVININDNELVKILYGIE